MIDSGWSIRFSPTPGRSWTDVDAEALQVAPRADAREQEEARRVDRPAGHDDLAARLDQVVDAAVAHDVHARRAAVPHLQPQRARLALDGEVVAVAHDRVQVHHAGRRAGSGRRVVADVEEADAVGERRGVPVGVRGHAGAGRRGLDPVEQERVAVLLRDDPVRARDAVVVRVHPLVVPARRALVDPVLPVERQRLEPDLRVVRRAAAEDARPRVHDVRVAARLQRGRVAVVVVALEQLQPAAQAQHLVAAEVGRAGLEQAHGQRRILGEASRHDGAGRASADDNHVEDLRHAAPPNARGRKAGREHTGRLPIRIPARSCR